MSLAIKCDGPGCSAMVENTYANKAAWVLITHKSIDKHFCAWNCAIQFVNEVDVLDGFEDK